MDDVPRCPSRQGVAGTGGKGKGGVGGEGEGGGWGWGGGVGNGTKHWCGDGVSRYCMYAQWRETHAARSKYKHFLVREIKRLKIT